LVKESRLWFEFTNPKTDLNPQGFILAQQTKPTFTHVRMVLNVESLTGQWAGIGIFTRLNDAKRSWADYWVRFGGDLPNNLGQMVYESAAIPGVTSSTKYLITDKLVLEIIWDGTQMRFLTNGKPEINPVPFPGYPDTFGIHWSVGATSTFKANVEEFDVVWK
jgi:hypothetical protein